MFLSLGNWQKCILKGGMVIINLISNIMTEMCMETFVINTTWWSTWSRQISRCFLPSERKHLCPCYPLLYIIFMPVKCCKCSHICYSLYKMQMHHLLRESPHPPWLGYILSSLIHADKLEPLLLLEDLTDLSMWGGEESWAQRQVCGRSSLFTQSTDRAQSCNMIVSV